MTDSWTCTDWHPPQRMAMKSPVAMRSVAALLEILECKGRSEVEKLPQAIVGERLGIGHENAIAHSDGHVAGDFPVDVKIPLPTEIFFTGIGGLVDGGIGV